MSCSPKKQFSGPRNKLFTYLLGPILESSQRENYRSMTMMNLETKNNQDKLFIFLYLNQKASEILNEIQN